MQLLQQLEGVSLIKCSLDITLGVQSLILFISFFILILFIPFLSHLKWPSIWFMGIVVLPKVSSGPSESDQIINSDICIL